jgi:hypothetical protein
VLRPLAIASGILLALALTALPGWIAVHRDDALEPDDRDLRLARAAAPPDNGYDRFVAAVAAARPAPRRADLAPLPRIPLRRELGAGLDRRARGAERGGE